MYMVRATLVTTPSRRPMMGKVLGLGSSVTGKVKETSRTQKGNKKKRKTQDDLGPLPKPPLREDYLKIWLKR